MPAPASADDAYARSIEAWRAQREARLRGDEGWPTVVALYWLRPGANRFGSAADNDLVLPASAAAHAGALRVDGTTVTLEPAAGAQITVDGAAATARRLRPDEPGPPDVVATGRVRLFLVERSGRLGVRVRDLDSPARRAFKGLRWYPIRPEYRVVGRLVPNPEPRRLRIANVLGLVDEMESAGVVVFTLGGHEVRLEPVYETPARSELFFIFRDRTSGHGTYPAGRFLYADLPRDGQVVIDFNKAYTPPCAFTRFATCPLPPRQNHLPIAIEAGELEPPAAH